ncbi:MAG: NACHT domain-containing protein, partial [Caldilineaceae bacterium]|nr:NACHT domain-containing protein [Caldilineaceae bacterium]
PYREETHRQIMRLLARMGQPDRALAQLERLRQLLHQEMGVDPDAATLTLAQQIAAGAFGKAQEPVLSLSEDDKGTGGQEDKVTGGQKLVLPSKDESSTDHPVIQSSGHPVSTSSPLDLSEVPLPGAFFGREQEQRQIAQWLVQERQQVVAILGIGGMGKTTLAAQCLRELASQNDAPFEALYWRSLVNAPPLDELLPPLLQSLSHQQLTKIPELVDEQLRLLLGYLRERRVLLVLDNVESILEPGAVGAYRPGYEPYGQLLQHMATLEHRSHLVLTSRERPRGYARLERDGYPVKSLFLAGLDHQAGRQLFLQRGVLSDSEQEAQLIARYSGNPLALKLVADTVEEIFGGNMAEFLADETLIFDDIRTVLDQHFARLTDLEQQILFWLAIERETTPLAALRGNLLNPPPQRVLLETLRNLHRRSLVERHEGGFALQNVITEYLTDRLVGEVYTEICTGTLCHLHHYALVKTQSKEYIRQSQIRILLGPVLQRLETDLTSAGVQVRLLALIQSLQTDFGLRPSYAGGTIINAMIHLGLNLEDIDL